MSAPHPDLTALFAQMRGGDADAGNVVAGAVYAELQRLASHYMRGENSKHTLQPTALVSEAYLRLMHGPDAVNDRSHFFALAAQAMRRVLVDHARQKRSMKRGGKAVQVTLQMVPGVPAQSVDVIALDQALAKLALVDARAARVVELRFFGGHTDGEVATILGEKLSAVRKDWEFARSWLKGRLGS